MEAGIRETRSGLRRELPPVTGTSFLTLRVAGLRRSMANSIFETARTGWEKGDES